jgi:hypothetical protein
LSKLLEPLPERRITQSLDDGGIDCPLQRISEPNVTGPLAALSFPTDRLKVGLNLVDLGLRGLAHF